MKKKVLHKAPLVAPKLKKTLQPPAHWDLYEDGLSYSLLSKFIVCRERFRLRTVEGLIPEGRKEALEFGTIFHKALELSAQGRSSSQIFAHLRKKVRSNEYDALLCRITAAMIPLYKDFWAEQLAELAYFESECVFDFPYTCSLQKTVRLRGKRDEGYVKDGRIWLQENKTKSQINEEQIIQTLGTMLQPMLYLLSFRNDHPEHEIGGILYNVIRRPGLKQAKKESDSAFVSRIVKDIDDRPSHYFKMYEIEKTNKDLEQWRLRYLDPLVSQVVLWWESIKTHPFDPWVDEDGLPNPHHFARPFGVYDPMSQGIGEYFGRVVLNNNVGLATVDTCFPELVED